MLSKNLMLKPSPEGEGFNPTQTWDNKSALAREYGISRQHLYSLMAA